MGAEKKVRRNEKNVLIKEIQPGCCDQLRSGLTCSCCKYTICATAAPDLSYICTHMYMHIHTHTCVCIYIDIQKNMFVYIYIYIAKGSCILGYFMFPLLNVLKIGLWGPQRCQWVLLLEDFD